MEITAKEVLAEIMLVEKSKEFANKKADLYLDYLGLEYLPKHIRPLIHSTFCAGFMSGVRYEVLDRHAEEEPGFPRDTL
jgi:hypothetical protein